ncbi:MAG TPA: peptidase S41, partial [Prolixibacteraceae bacterium]|nr:peptidase S41 [Prolixibacteraceae bacterium]
MNKRNPVFYPLILAVTLALGVLIGSSFHRRPLSPVSRDSAPGNKLNHIIELIESAYVDTINTAEIVENSIPALLENLDPHTTYIPAREMQGVEEEMQGNFSGIGVQFSIQEDTIMI